MAILPHIKLCVRAWVDAVRETTSREIAEFGSYRPICIAFGPDRFVRVHPRYVELLGGALERPEANFDREHFSEFIAGLRALVEGHGSHVTLAHRSGGVTVDACPTTGGTVVIGILAGGDRERFQLHSGEVKLLIRTYEEAVASMSPVTTPDYTPS